MKKILLSLVAVFIVFQIFLGNKAKAQCPFSDSTYALGSTTICQGTNVVIAAYAYGINYQWQLNGTNISGATGQSYSVSQSGIYTANLTDSLGVCNKISQPIVITVVTAPTTNITANGSTSFCSGGSVQLAVDSGYVYQWKKNGTNISGATSRFYTATQTGSYNALVSANGCSINSGTISVNASGSLSDSIYANGSTTVCQGTKLLLTAQAPNARYQWRLNGNPISGAIQKTDSVYQSGTYTVAISDSANQCSLTSLPIVVNVINCNANWNIEGYVYGDNNTNCIIDTTDNRIGSIRVELWEQGILAQQTFTTNNGEYFFSVSNYDSFQIKIDTAGLPFYLSCPNQQILTTVISAVHPNDFNRNFAVSCKTNYNDIKAQSISASIQRKGRAAFLLIDVTNTGIYNNCSGALTGKIKLIKTGPAKFSSSYYSTTPAMISNDSLIWNVTSFNGSIAMIVNIDSTAQIGQSVCYKLIALPNVSDINPHNDTLIACFNIASSFDPNVKSVVPQGNLSANDSILTYTIQFQNTGNDTAFNIVVNDTLDSNLDVSTIQVLSSSFPTLAQTTGQSVSFNFANIKLVDSTTNEPLSHGFVTFSVKRFTGNNGTIIPNVASIYFDLNPAVVTDTTMNRICNSPSTYSFTHYLKNSSDSFIFKNDTLRSVGNYNDTLVNYVGCDSIVTLHLLLCSPISNNISKSICGSQTYYFHHQNLSVSGSYHDTLTNVNGCDSIINLTLNVVTTIRDSFTQTICSPQTFTFNSQTLSANGFYSDTLTSSGGCDSISTLHLIVKNPSAHSITATICSNDIYTLNTKTFSNAGIYNDTINNYLGCDSIITLTLNVNNISATPSSQITCSNQPYLFGGNWLNASGTYYDTLINYLGCDSLLILTLTVNNISTSSFSATTCANQPYAFGSQLLSVSGTYFDTLTNYIGCDSIITLNLTANPSPTTNISQNICLGQTFTFNGQSLSSGGLYYDTLQTYLSCDSIIALTLNVISPSGSTQNQSICTNHFYTFGGNNLTLAGTYFDTIPNYGGCDSIITLNLTVLDSSSSISNQTICSSQPYFFNGHYLNTPNTYYDTLVNYVGCDSLLILNLSVTPSSYTNLSATTCSNQPYTFFSQSLTASGTYHDTLSNYIGCDSIVTLNLTVNQTHTTNLNQGICIGQTFTFNGQSLSSGGLYHDTLQTYWGCDSFINLNLTINNPTFYSYNHTICSNNTYSFNGNLLNSNGTYYDTLTNYLGCDSFITLNLTVNPISNYSFAQTVCNNNPYFFNNQFLNSSGTYYDTLTNYLGCDSFITLNLTVNPISNYSYNQLICQNNPIVFNGILRDTTGTFYDTLVNYLGCDSFITLHLHAVGISNQINGVFVCAGQTYNFYGHILSTPGVYIDTLSGYLGCDSLITIHLHVLNNSSYSFTQTICGGQSYTFNGNNLTIPGTYYDTLTNYLGCDSLITLHLQAGSNSFSTINQNICSGASYTFNGQVLTVSGTYFDTIINAGGCNTLITLNLTVLNSTSSTIAQTICNGQTYNFYGQHLIASGVYTHHLINHLGCDSSVVLTLTVNTPNVNIAQTDTVLQAQATGSTYQWVHCQGSNNNIYVPIVGATSQTYIADTTGWFAVIVTTNGCTDTSVCYFVNKFNTGINSIANNSIKVYPNPTDKILNIKCQPEDQLRKIILQDALGRNVKELQVVNNTETISLEGLPAGIYFLHLFAKTEAVMKIVKE